jgi:predicted nucleotidyltransferase
MLPDSLPKKVTEAIRTFKGTIKQVYPDARLYLYGSFARGDWLEDSDIDMVVVSEGFSGELVERMSGVRRLAPSGVAWEILTYTPDEMEHKLQSSLTWQDIASYWIELTNDDEVD